MRFDEIINSKYSTESDRTMMQKTTFPVNEALEKYLLLYGRDVPIPVLYNDLTNYSYAHSLKDNQGKWTFWENAVYEPAQLESLKEALMKTYAILKKQHLPASSYDIERIDFCEYGNSIPFRIKIINTVKGTYEFFYIKMADASRIYGLELEHLLTHNPINFLYHRETLIEEHIQGTPADIFLQQNPELDWADKKNIAKSFVQFNESCFARLLGDMRSYNFVINPLSINGCTQYRIRAIDFDQQSYEGRKNLYFPQFFKDNAAYVEMVLQSLTATEIEQNQQKECASMAARIIKYRRQLMELVNSMVHDDISENYKIKLLRNELNEHFQTNRFSTCKTMGAIVKQQLKQVLQKHVRAANLK